jgi:hypothetical protein
MIDHAARTPGCGRAPPRSRNRNKGDPGEKGNPGHDGIDGKDGAPGQNGRPGENGAPGLSAYQQWLDDDDTGTVGDFMKWLKGEKGDEGPPGPKGDTGPPVSTETGEICVNKNNHQIAWGACDPGNGGMTGTTLHVYLEP